MRRIFIIIVFILISTNLSVAQDAKIIQTEFKVFGNCEMCKSRIEKAVKINEVKYAKWNKNTKMLKIAFVSTIDVDSLHKRIAEVGHDTEKYKAQDEVYSSLPKCCLYRDKANTH
jgi:hypothetical protein